MWYSLHVCFLGAIDTSIPGCSKLTFSCEKRLMLKTKPDKKAEESCQKLVEFDEFEYTTDSWTSASKARQRPKDTVKVRLE